MPTLAHPARGVFPQRTSRSLNTARFRSVGHRCVDAIQAILCTRHKTGRSGSALETGLKSDTYLGDVPDLRRAVKLVNPCPRASLEPKNIRFAPGARLAEGEGFEPPEP